APAAQATRSARAAGAAGAAGAARGGRAVTEPPGGPGLPGGLSARWVLTPNMSWLGRAGMAIVLAACLVGWGLGEVVVLLVIFATLGAATGLWSRPHSFVMTTYAPTGYLLVAGAVLWLALWTGGGSFTAGMLHTVLCGRDVIELLPGELRVRRRW